MRITTAHHYDSQIANLQRRQRSLTEAQEQLTSGKRVRLASDDPAAAARAERALAAESRAEAQQRAVDASKHAMQLAEGALGDAGELLQQARETLVAAGNGTLGDNERAILGERVHTLRNELLGIANRGDGAGRWLFFGQGHDGAPLVDAPGGVAYAATPGTLLAAEGVASPLSIDGRAAFLEAPDPANPGSVLSVFDVLDRVAAELATPGRTSAEVAQTVRDGIGDVDAVMSNLSRWRARAGEALNGLDASTDRLAQDKLDAQTERSQAEDLDLVAAISDFQNQQSGYDAALKTYALVQRMSLFDYLK